MTLLITVLWKLRTRRLNLQHSGVCLSGCGSLSRAVTFIGMLGTLLLKPLGEPLTYSLTQRCYPVFWNGSVYPPFRRSWVSSALYQPKRDQATGNCPEFSFGGIALIKPVEAFPIWIERIQVKRRHMTNGTQKPHAIRIKGLQSSLYNPIARDVYCFLRLLN